MSAKPSYTIGARSMPTGYASATVEIAMRVALAYVHRTPSVEELRERFGMSRPTAYRWIAAIRAAKGEPSGRWVR